MGTELVLIGCYRGLCRSERRESRVNSINSALFELELEGRMREIERRAERRRLVDELVHFPCQTRKSRSPIRTLLAGVRGHGGMQP